MNVEYRENKSKKIILIIAACVLAAALIVFGIWLVTTLMDNDRIMKNETALQGVTVNGVDISGMKKDEALAATAKVPDEVLDKITFSVDVEGEKLTFKAADLNLSTDYEDVVSKALDYGNTGTLEERKKAIADAKAQGVAFTVKASAKKEDVLKVLQPYQEKLDKDPVDAGFQFTPWGHLADGTPYEQDQQPMIEACAKGKTWERPELVRIADDQMPNILRYEYWKNTKYNGFELKDGKYVASYRPPDASIERFYYKESVNGRKIDLDAVADSIVSATEAGKYNTITAPVQAVEPSVKLEDVKKSTQLIASWTSSYGGSSHYNYNRNWNVAKMSGKICGQIIQPSEEWSINKTAGNRTVASGWKKAAGIENGGYTQQPGGGVCQISSTLFNAAIRANLGTDTAHHSISSDYIPIGLDATISSGNPDLKIVNPYNTPIYIVSYMNPDERCVTVEIYGQPLTDAKYGDIILHYTSVGKGSYGTPTMKYVYNTAVCPEDGTVIAAGKSYPYAKARKGKRAQTYKHILSLEGKVLSTENYKYYDIKPVNGTTYVNGPENAEPTTSPSTSPSTSTSTSPSTSTSTSPSTSS
jgi:uncharacterized protein YoxC